MKTPRSAFVRQCIFVCITAACVGAACYFALRSEYITGEYNELNARYYTLLTSAGIANVPRYGVIQSIDPQQRTITLLVEGIYDPGVPPFSLTVHILPNAVIAYQELEGTGGVYDAISATEPASFADLQVGDKVAAQVTFANSEFETSLVLFGNPL